jgi:hypothetical protein
MKYLILLLLLIAASSNAQSIGASTYNSAGGSATIGSITHEYAIAEMALVSTSIGSNIIVTQGVLQPSTLLAEAVNDITKLNTVISIYPNPTSNILHIHILDANFKIGELGLMDAVGKVVFKNDHQQILNGTIKIDMTNYASGNYYLQINKQYTYKIIKTKN